jgi:glucan phosphoethanolaminetransferase (alkaline phosphatase superfamily)
MRKARVVATVAYILGTFLMFFGWLGAMAQSDAPQNDPRITSLVLGFAMALALLTLSAVLVYRGKRRFRYAQICFVGIQAAVCLYAIIAEFAL